MPIPTLGIPACARETMHGGTEIVSFNVVYIRAYAYVRLYVRLYVRMCTRACALTFLLWIARIAIPGMLLTFLLV